MSGPSIVRVELGTRSYDVYVGEGAVDAALDITASAVGPGRVIVIADRNVATTHAARVADGLRSRGSRVDSLGLPIGESAKTLETVGSTAETILSAPLERGDVIVGVGGGAATDVAGFVAAILLRGVRWVSIPTTLLGQVDAAVGGKTGVNVPVGKNLLGVFHQPLVVACDPQTLTTLPEREFRAGLAEVVKTAWIGDPDLFSMLENDPPQDSAHPGIVEIVRRCVAVKAAIVSEDEREGGRRAVLNFGHTLGHAIETEANGRYLHGEAVALGLVTALHLSVATHRCDEALLGRIVAVLTALGLPVADRDLDIDAVIARTRQDKKRQRGKDRYQLTSGIGFVSVAEDLPEGAPRAALEFLRR